MRADFYSKTRTHKCVTLNVKERRWSNCRISPTTLSCHCCPFFSEGSALQFLFYRSMDELNTAMANLDRDFLTIEFCQIGATKRLIKSQTKILQAGKRNRFAKLQSF